VPRRSNSNKLHCQASLTALTGANGATSGGGVKPIATLDIGGLTELTHRGLSVVVPSWSAFRYKSIQSETIVTEQSSAQSAWSSQKNSRSTNDHVNSFVSCGIEVAFEDIEGLTAIQQQDFECDFARDLAQLAEWAAEHGWAPMLTPKLRAVVSRKYRISKSLVPAWYGRAGHMEFPVWRVATRRAAIAHELVHVFFPNANRFLAEGLAVYLQSEIGGNPAFPNFGRPLHDLARESMLAMAPRLVSDELQNFDHIALGRLDAIATPGPLELQVGGDFYGEEPRGQARLYPLAGSFVQFLIETRGTQAFRKLYSQTPLVPLQQNAGASERWTKIYGRSLAQLEREWKFVITCCNAMTLEKSRSNSREQNNA